MKNLIAVSSQSRVMSINDFLNNYTSASTRKAYKTDIVNFFKFIKQTRIDINSINELNIADLISYRDSLFSSKTSKTAARGITTIKTLFKWLYKNELIEQNIASSLIVPKANVTTPTNAFTDEEVKLILNKVSVDSFSKNNHRLMLFMLLYMGLRRSELVNIKLKDIIMVDSDLILRVNGKGNKLRELLIPESVKKELAMFNDYHKNLGVVLKEDDWLFQSSAFRRNTKPMNPGTVFNVLKRYLIKCGIDRRLSPHSCRATAITKALEEGAIINEVADMAGHSNIQTTQIYWKRRNGFKNAATKKIHY